MLEKDVPQDEGMSEGLKAVCYAVNNEGNYVLVPSAGWEAKQITNDQAWDVINEQIEAMRQEVLAGKKSMLAFHMTKNLMDSGLLAQYAGFSRFRVWLHLRPAFFARLPQEKLLRYAKIFEISVEELTDMSQLDGNGKP